MSQQQRIQGCIFGNIRPAIDLPMFADWYVNGRLRLDDLHTATIPLDDVPKVFKDGSDGIRTIVRFGE